MLAFNPLAICFEFRNAFDALEFLTLQPEPVDYLLVNIETLLRDDPGLQRAVDKFCDTPNVIVGAYTRLAKPDLFAIRRRVASDLIFMLGPGEGYESVVAHIQAFDELKKLGYRLCVF